MTNRTLSSFILLRYRKRNSRVPLQGWETLKPEAGREKTGRGIKFSSCGNKSKFQLAKRSIHTQCIKYRMSPVCHLLLYTTTCQYCGDDAGAWWLLGHAQERLKTIDGAAGFWRCHLSFGSGNRFEHLQRTHQIFGRNSFLHRNQYLKMLPVEPHYPFHNCPARLSIGPSIEKAVISTKIRILRLNVFGG